MTLFGRPTFRFAFAIVLPAVLVLVGTWTAVLVSLGEMANTVNDTDTTLTSRSADAAVHATVRRMAETVGDYANWDDAARNLYGEPNPLFVDENLAGSTATPIFFDTAYLVDGGGHDLLGFRLGETVDLPSSKAFGPALASMIAELPTDRRSYDARSGLVNGAWGLAIVGVAPVVPVSEDFPVPAGEVRFLVIGKAFDSQEVHRLGEDYVIKGLALGDPKPVSDDRLGLVDYDGNTVAWLTWSPRQSGTEAHARVSPLAITMLALVGLTMAVLVILAVVGVVRLQRKESEARHAATHDSLTGLPNRNSLVSHLQSAIAAMRRGSIAVAVAYLDLDGFKEVNDTYGHEIGDELLRRVAAAFTRLCREHFLVRVGGDEFAVVIEGTNAAAAAKEISERLIGFFKERLDINGRVIPLSTSIGIVVVESTGISIEELLRRADVAMYQAKRLGRGRICVFDRHLDAERLRRIAVAADLRRALAAGELTLAYQPVFDAGTGRVVSVEALLRWPRPGGIPLGPAEFIPIAEETGLIDDLGFWTIRSACRDALAWPGIRVSVNVSPAQFQDPDFVSVVSATLRGVGFPAERLEIEVTEGYFVQHPEQARSVIDALRKLGVTVALDDFGTGYSSIGYLRRFAFDKLKIDQTLVRNVNSDRKARELLLATVQIGRALGLIVTAEGVENEEQAILLRAAGCHEFQGFFFAKPEPAAAIGDRLERERALGRPPMVQSA